MNVPPYQIIQCRQPNCRFRFPLTDNRVSGDRCPHCGAPTSIEEIFDNRDVAEYASNEAGPPLVALLDNIRSIFNVGSMFRTADGAGIRHLHLCGITTTPDHAKMAKTALGAELSVPWTQHRNGVDAAAELKAQGYRLWAVEVTPNAVPLSDLTAELPGPPIALVVGNEVSGIDPGILALCDRELWLPMAGQKRSLNVAVAFGIAAYVLRFPTAVDSRSQ